MEKDAILNSLPGSYRPFLTNFRMTKLVVNYHQLLGLLQTFEKDHQLLKGSVNLVGGSSRGRGTFKKGKKKNKNQKKKVQRAKPSQTKKIKADHNLAKCFYCKKQGH